MELVDGVSLAERLRRERRARRARGAAPLHPAVRGAAARVRARRRAPRHQAREHPDRRDGGARLVDLGLAFADDDPLAHERAATLGTPHYISPEQARDPRSADVQSDIWSLGATLYHAVCGRPPFSRRERGRDPLGRPVRARARPGGARAASSRAGFALVLRKCLTRDPAQRYQTPARAACRPRARARAARAAGRRAQPRPGRAQAAALGAAGAARGSALLGLALVFAAAVRLGERGQWAAARPARRTPPLSPPLDVLAARAEVAPEGSGAILRELEDLRPRLPAAPLARLGGRARARADPLEADLAAAADRADAASERLSEAGDFAGARAALAVELPRELVTATGFSLDELEERFGFLRARRQALLTRRDQGESQLAKDLARKVPELTTGLIQEAGRLQASGRYKSALDLLAVDDEGLLAAAGYGGYRFSSDRIEGLFADARTRLGLKRQEVDFAWRSVDSELRDFVDRRTARLRETLTAPDDPSLSAAVELGRSFENELFERGLERGEMPAESSRIALTQLEYAQRELLRLEDERREPGLKAAYNLNLDLDGSRWTRRDYGAVLSLWSDFAETLRSAPGDRALAGASTRRAHRAEARGGAAARSPPAARRGGRAAADGEQRELMVGASGIVEEGTISAGLDPLRDGFELLPDHGSPFHLTLRPSPGATCSCRGPAADRRGPLAAGPRGRRRLPLPRARARARGGHPALGASCRRRASRPSWRRTSVRDPGASSSARSRRATCATARSPTCSTWPSEEAILEAPDRALMAIDKLLRSSATCPTSRSCARACLEEQRRLENRRHSFEDSYRPERAGRGARRGGDAVLPLRRRVGRHLGGRRRALRREGLEPARGGRRLAGAARSATAPGSSCALRSTRGATSSSPCASRSWTGGARAAPARLRPRLSTSR